jgi:transposase-like protein
LKPVQIDGVDHWCCNNCRKDFTDLRGMKKVKPK